MKRPARAQPSKAMKRPAKKTTTLRRAVLKKQPSAQSEGSCRDDGAFKGSVNLWFVRHGETENNVMLRNMREEFSDLPKVELTKRYNLVRGDDPGLSPLGLSQCQALPTHPALASLLKSGRPVDIYSSPLRRAIESAGPLQKALPGTPPIRLIPDLCEIGGLRKPTANGDVLLPGENPAELQNKFPDLALDVSGVPAAGWWVGQSKEYTTEVRGCKASWTRAERLARLVRQLRPTMELQNKDTSDIIIVGHGQMFDYLVTELLGTPREQFTVKHGNTGVTHLEMTPSFTRMHCVNVMPTVVKAANDNTATMAT